MNQVSERARRLYDDSVVIDGLNVSEWDSDAVYESLNEGGVAAINATIATWENYRETLDHISRWLVRFRERSDRILQVETVEDIHRAKREGKTGVILGWQNTSPIENRLDRLELFHRLGVRIAQVTYHERNLLGDGCMERQDGGLTNFGVDAVKEMNRVGILIDLSHVGMATTMDSIEVSDKPVAITHANAKSYYEHRRNKTDEAIKLMAEKGGVIGSTCIRTFLRNSFSSTLVDYLEAIDHLVDMVGVDHVAIGTDHTQDQPDEFWRYIGSQQGTKFPSTFTQVDEKPKPWRDLYPDELETPAQLPVMSETLLNRGYSDEDVRKILGGNWLRLFEEVWSSNDFSAFGDTVRGGYHSRVMWRPCAEPCSRHDNGGNAGLADCNPRRDSERSYSHTNANHCCERSGTSGGHARSHTDGYSDGGADQTANTGAHGHTDGYSDGGADQTANTGAHGHSNRYSDVGADQTPNTGARSHSIRYSDVGADQTANTGARSHSNRYSDVGADQTANTGTHSHASGLIPPPRL